MCMHDREERERYRQMLKERQEKLKKLPRTALVSVNDADGNFVGAMPAEWRSAQKVANTVRDLQSWHPNAVNVDLDDVNKMRKVYDTNHPTEYMPPLRAYSLPAPTGNAEPYAFAKPEQTWDDTLKEAAQYIHTQHAKVARKRVSA